MPSATEAIDDEHDAPDQPDGNATPSYAGSCVMSGISRADASKDIYFWNRLGKAPNAPTGFGRIQPVVTGRRLRTISRMATMSLLMAIRVISACSREIGVGNGKNK